MTCLGDVVAALVDGELEHAARERAQRHLAHCAGCRAEVEAHRGLKSRLGGAGQEPAPSDALTARLLQMRPPVEGARRAAPARPLATRPVTPRAAVGPRRRLARRGAAVGSALAVLGIGAALALGGPAATRPSTPLNPGSDVFVVDFVSSTSDTGSVGAGR
ncbi:MAG: hypothetical protein H7323_07675 [Frankiales bacterium]|nr:hypothetical protein [Frankiales bacterium]